MKVLFVSGTYYPALSGAEVSAQTIIAGLARYGVRCLVVTSSDTCGGQKVLPKHVNGVNILWALQKDARSAISHAINYFQPDVILTQLMWSDYALEFAKASGIPSLLRVCSIPHPIDISIDLSLAPTLVFAVSEAATRDVESRWGRKCEIHRPPIDPARITAKNISRRSSKGLIAMFNSVVSKGADVFKEIAKSMQDREFAVIHGWSSLRGRDGRFNRQSVNNLYASIGIPKDTEMPQDVDFADVHNVRLITPTEDVRKIYSKISILCVPSQTEAYGRVAIEGMINGIPVVASAVGGLREAVGKAGVLIDNYKDPYQWVEELRRLENTEIYERFCNLGPKHAEPFCDIDASIKQLLVILRKTVI